jgi:hypothetical protein
VEIPHDLVEPVGSSILGETTALLGMPGEAIVPQGARFPREGLKRRAGGKQRGIGQRLGPKAGPCLAHLVQGHP